MVSLASRRARFCEFSAGSLCSESEPCAPDSVPGTERTALGMAGKIHLLHFLSSVEARFATTCALMKYVVTECKSF